MKHLSVFQFYPALINDPRIFYALTLFICLLFFRLGQSQPVATGTLKRKVSIAI